MRAPLASSRFTIHAPMKPCAPVIRKVVSGDHIFEHRQPRSVIGISLVLHLLHYASTHRHATIAGFKELLIERRQVKQEIKRFSLHCAVLCKRERMTASIRERLVRRA